MNSEKMLQLIYTEVQGINKRLDGVDERFVSVDERFDRMDKRFEAIDERFDRMDERFEAMDERFDRMDERFEAMDKRFDTLEMQVAENTREIKKINLCLENEIRPNIMRIAEGHLDLSRKLDEALKIDQEKERMAVKLNFLEGRVDRLEATVAGLT